MSLIATPIKWNATDYWCQEWRHNGSWQVVNRRGQDGELLQLSYIIAIVGRTSKLDHYDS